MANKPCKLYTCDACRYTFGCNVRPNYCPDCGKSQHNGKPAVRPATSGEIKEYYIIREEIAAEDRMLASNQ